MLLEKEYSIPLDLYRQAFAAFQKKYVYPKCYRMMGIYAMFACLLVWLIAAGSAELRNLFCIGFMACLVGIAMQWYNPRKMRVQLVESIREMQEDRYRLEVFKEKLTVVRLAEEEAEQVPSEIRFDGVFVQELAELFLLVQADKTFYIVPKQVFSAEELELFRKTVCSRFDKE